MTRDELQLIDLPERIETPRLYLRPPQAGDGSALLRAILDGYDDYVKWLQWPNVPPSEEECELECRRHHASWILRTDMRFLCFNKDNGQLIGRFAYPDFQCVWATPLVAISYFIQKSKRGKGFATEATRALADYAFDQFRAKKVEIKCDIDNPASCRIPEKLGFDLECTQRGVWPKPGDSLAQIRTYACFQKSSLLHLEIS